MVDMRAEISPPELASAQSKVLWAGMLVAGVGGLTLAAYLGWGLLIRGLFTLFTWMALDPPNLLYQGILYVVFAVFVWRRSMFALAIATLIFLADSGIYTFRQLPLLSGLSLSLLNYWPWSAIVAIAIRAVVLWILVA